MIDLTNLVSLADLTASMDPVDLNVSGDLVGRRDLSDYSYRSD